MRISGIRTHIYVGSREFLRCPRCLIESRRHAPLGRAALNLPDPTGELGRSIAEGSPVEIRLGYRDQAPAIWQGTVSWTRRGATADQLRIGAVDGALPLSATRITQAWQNETPEAIVAWAIRRTGLTVGRIDGLDVGLPRFVASNVPVWQLVRQVAHSCQKAFGVDMSRWALWLGADGVNWGDLDEPGGVPTIATGAGLIGHAPGGGPAAVSEVETFLLPGLTHSRRFHLQDIRRGVDETLRALTVRHEIEPKKARTYLCYGEEYGRF